MDNKEKISVELELLTEKFSNKIKTMTNKIGSFGKYIKENLQIKDEGFDLEKAVGDLAYMQDKMNNAPDINSMLRYQKTALAIAKDIEEYTDETDDAIESTNKFGLSIKQNFSKGINSIKKFALSLFSIRSIYSLISRASSQYLSQDTETANKLQAAWIGLGSIFAPLIEKIANFVIKAVKYINIFVKALTGADYLTRAMTKSMDKLNKSAKATSKTLASFDELQNLDTDVGSSGLDTDWIDAFKDVELNEKWVSFFDNLGKKLRSVADYLPLVLGSALLGTGLLGLNATLGNLATIGVITIGVSLVYTAMTGRSLIEDLKEVHKGLDDIKNINNEAKGMAEKNAEATNSLIETYKRLEETTGVTEDKTKAYINTLFQDIETNNDLIDSLDEQKTWLGYVTGSNQKLIDTQQVYWDSTDNIIEELGRLYKEGKLNDDQTKIYTETVEKQITKLEKLKKKFGENSDEYKNNESKIKSLKSTLKDLTGQDYTIKTSLEEPDTKNYETKLGNFFYNVGEAVRSFGSRISTGLNSLFNFKDLPSYDVGTNYVPNDQLAMVHKGEAIIPAKYNNNNYNGTSEIVYQLDKLNSTLENKDFNTYLDGKTIGKTAQNYINNQSRIMGRSVI